MPLLPLAVLVVVIGSLSIYVDRRFIRNRKTAPKAPKTDAKVAAEAATPASPAIQETQEVKNGAN